MQTNLDTNDTIDEAIEKLKFYRDYIFTGKLSKEKVVKRIKEYDCPNLALIYASEFLKAPVPELEFLIAKSRQDSLLYAQLVLKGRFEQGEESIKSSANLSYLYANKVIHRRFKISEQTLLNSENSLSSYELLNYYTSHFKVGERWKELEDKIFDNKNFAWESNYYFQHLSVVSPEDEEQLKSKVLKSKSAQAAVLLVKHTLKRRFPEAEVLILKEGEHTPVKKDYIKLLEGFNVNRSS